jgi:hypothetical protein
MITKKQAVRNVPYELGTEESGGVETDWME